MTSEHPSSDAETQPPEGAAVVAHRRAIDALDLRIAPAERRIDRISTARLVTFVGGAGLLFSTLLDPSLDHRLLYLGAGAAFVVFAALVVRHDLLFRRVAALRGRRDVHRDAIARAARDWRSLPLRPVSEERATLPVARDLGLFGHGSLRHLLFSVTTPPGSRTLESWLLHPAEPREIGARQEAVRELTGDPDFRVELERRARALEPDDPTLERFLEWAEDEPWLRRRPLRLWLARALTAATLASVAGWLLAGMPVQLFVIALLVNFSVGFFSAEPIHDVFGRVASRERSFRSYASLLEHLIGLGRPRSARLRSIVSALETEDADVARELRRLERAVELCEVRRGGLFHFILATGLLWDFHVLAYLERWQERCGHRARVWLDLLGEVEVLAGFANLVADETGWVFPGVIETLDRLRARELAHPLIAADRRVANDVEVGPPGTVLLVTGSNMSGKSTLLRAIGLNAVLAHAGAPVCAAELTMPEVRLGTSMLIEDSLIDGVSFFMAELQRLKEIVDAADRAAESDHAPRLLFLLDEILRGTNSVERLEAVRRVLAHLSASGAMGALSTHDLRLTEAPEIVAVCRTVHFRETVDSEGARPMTFDYRLRPGPATTRNALELLRLVGLDDPRSEGEVR